MISTPTSAVTTATRCSCAQLFRTTNAQPKKRVVGGCSSTKFDRRKKAPLRQKRMCTTTEAKKKSADDMESAEKSIKAPSIPSVADSQDEDIDSCAFVLCSVDNDQFEDRSLMSISIQSIPGLMRVISWLLEGLDLEIWNAKITTDDEGFVKMDFEIVEKTYDDAFVKLTDPEAVKERMEDYLNFCVRKDRGETTFGVKTRRGVCVDNESSNDTTIATVVVNTSPVKTLLPISSAVTALKLKIDSAVLVGGESDGECVVDCKKWRFELVNAESGKKLNSQEANALMYTLTLLVQSATNVTGQGKSSSAAARDIAEPEQIPPY
jgi:UTP:GlnB (protein PII) uridylyltransferase